MSETRRRSFVFKPGGHHGAGDEFDINLAPVIDCLTVLIVYTMVSASFLSLGVFGATVPSESMSTVVSPPTIQVQVNLTRNHTIEVTTSGQERGKVTLPPQGSEWDLNGLGEKLAQLKSRFSSLNTVTVIAYSGIEYRDVVRVIERSKRSLPHVVLGD